MILLFIIADDFTGALDTGVQFAARGIPTQVTVDPEVDFAAHDTAVLVVDTETRHLTVSETFTKRQTRRCAGISVRSLRLSFRHPGGRIFHFCLPSRRRGG